MGTDQRRRFAAGRKGREQTGIKRAHEKFITGNELPQLLYIQKDKKKKVLMASQKRRSCTKTEPYKQNQKMRMVSRLSYTEGAHARLDAEAAGEKPSRAERGRGGVRAATAPSCPHPREHLGALHTSWRGAPLRPGQLRVSCPRLLVTRHLPPCEPVSVTGLQIHQLHFRPPIQWQSAHFYFVGGRGPIC